MTTALTGFRIFIASPGGLGEIRKAFRVAVENYNAEDAIRRGVVFIPVGWEATLGGMGRPQAIINRELEECDALLLVLHDRWGSDPGAADGSSSGTEEEFRLARVCHADEDKQMREIQVFFRSVDPGRMADPGPQLQKVLDFKAELERERQLMFYQFEETTDFADRLRMFLASCVHELERSTDAGGGAAHTRSHGDVGIVADAGTAAEEPPEGEPPLIRARRLARDGRVTEAETILAERVAGAGDVEAMLDYGMFLMEQRRKTQATAMLERAVVNARVVGDEILLGRAELGDSRLLARFGKSSEAISLARSATEHLSEEAGAYLAEARIFLAELMPGGEERAEVDELLAAAEAHLVANPDPRLRAQAAAVRARLALDDEETDVAVDLFAMAIAAAHEAGFVEDLGDLYVGLGSALEADGKAKEARQAYLDAETALEKSGDLAKLADAVDHLGHVSDELGDDGEAQRAFDKAAGLFETMQRHGSAVDSYTSLSKLHEAAGRRKEAEMVLRQALGLADRLEGREEVEELYTRLEALISSDRDAAEEGGGE